MHPYRVEPVLRPPEWLKKSCTLNTAGRPALLQTPFPRHLVVSGQVAAWRLVLSPGEPWICPGSGSCEVSLRLRTCAVGPGALHPE